MIPNWTNNQRFMVLDDKYWYEGDSGWWHIMHGIHDIRLQDGAFYNYHQDAPKLIGNLDEAFIMSAQGIHAITSDLTAPFENDDYNESLSKSDLAWEDIMWRMRQAKIKTEKRKYLVE